MKKILLVFVAVLLAFPARATTEIYLDSTSGNFGVGTTTPSYALDVLGSTTSNVVERLSSADTDSTNLLLNNTTTGGVAWYVGTAGSSNVLGESVGDFHIGLNGTGSYLIIGTGGNVSIPYNLGVTGNLSVTGAATLGNGSTAVTQTSTDNSTAIATDAFVQSVVSGGGTGIKSVHVQTFTSSGTYTPTTGMSYAIVEMVGGGGGSAGNASNTGSPGGGSGGYLKALLTAAQIGSSQSVTIGAAGTAGTTTPTDGGNGGTTSLGSLLSCTGGDGSAYTTTGGSSADFNVGGAGGSPTVSTGTAIFTQIGGQGDSGGQSFYSNGGWSVGGRGGSNPLGQGGGNVYGGSSNAASNHITGNSGVGYGAGAGGPIDQSNTAIAGTAGQPGVVIITEFCTQ